MGFGGYISHPRGRLATLVENVLPHLTSLRSLDLGEDTGFGIGGPEFTMIHSCLTYLRVSLQHAAHLYYIMSSKTLSTSLEQIHVTMRSMDPMCQRIVPEDLELPRMMHLHTFTLIQTILSDNRYEWSTIESLLTPVHLPVLRRVNLAIFISADDLYEMKRSLLFTDDRRVDVQFAFIVDNSSPGIQLSDQIPHGSRFHPRQVVGVTCVVNELSAKHQHLLDMDCHVSIFK